MHFKREGIPIFGGKAQNETEPDTRVFAGRNPRSFADFVSIEKKQKKNPRVGKTGIDRSGNRWLTEATGIGIGPL